MIRRKWTVKGSLIIQKTEDIQKTVFPTNGGRAPTLANLVTLQGDANRDGR